MCGRASNEPRPSRYLAVSAAECDYNMCFVEKNKHKKESRLVYGYKMLFILYMFRMESQFYVYNNNELQHSPEKNPSIGSSNLFVSFFHVYRGDQMVHIHIINVYPFGTDERPRIFVFTEETDYLVYKLRKKNG